MTSVVEFGYQGQRSEIGRAIPVAHVRVVLPQGAPDHGSWRCGPGCSPAARPRTKPRSSPAALITRIEALGRVR